MTSFEEDRKAIREALVLGLDAEKDDPNMAFLGSMTERQVEWVASWLASEGIGKRKS